jgi:hypothetical protein
VRAEELTRLAAAVAEARQQRQRLAIDDETFAFWPSAM